MIPIILADNAGYDSSELISQLRASHYEGKINYGLDMKNGCIGDVRQLGVIESFKVKLQVLLSASECAEMILRIDEIIKAPARKRSHDPRHGH